jgi:predicted RNA binding protein YcfA (HicA-like mRNA interferase family)
MCRILMQHGWSQVRTKGSHHAFQKTGSPLTIVVPVHGNRSLKKGTQHGIMKDAGLTDDDL